MPKTCSYRLINEGKKLPSWHYLLTGNFEEMEIENTPNHDEKDNYDRLAKKTSKINFAPPTLVYRKPS